MLKFKTFVKLFEESGMPKKMFEKVVYNPLKHNDLTKYGGKRADDFLAKVKLTKPKNQFMTKKGDAILKTPPPMPKPDEFKKAGFKTTFKSDKGDLRYPGDFLKSPEFGGKGQGSGTVQEDAFLKKFRKHLEDTIAKAKTGALDMIVGGRTIEVAGVGQPPGTPKADFYLLNTKGEQVGWLSHKDYKGKGPKDFQQYGGLTEAGFYKNNKEVQSFVSKIKELYPDGLPPKTSVYRKNISKRLQQTAIWGKDFGKARGLQNVDEFHQGEMKIVPAPGKKFKIISKHYDTNGNVPKVGSGYEGVLHARHTKAAANYGIKTTRMGVFPIATIPRAAKEI